jgi:hypothetical protein
MKSVTMKGTARLVLLPQVRQSLPTSSVLLRGYSSFGGDDSKKASTLNKFAASFNRSSPPRNPDSTPPARAPSGSSLSIEEGQKALQNIYQVLESNPSPGRAPPAAKLEFYPKVDLQVAKRRLWLTDLKHFKLYPKTIKDWVVDCKTPRGVWETNGTWRATMMLESEAEDETSAETAAQAREREILLGAKVLPADLRDRYRFGVTEEDIRALELTAPQANKLKEILSYKYAGRAEINQFRIAECLKKWSRKANDTGSSEVQSALLLAFAALRCVYV